MKKTSTYARKKAVQTRQADHERIAQLIMADLRGLQIDAGLHTWTGNYGAKMVNLSGRLCFITAYAANHAGIDTDNLDVRILRGMANALGDMAEDLECVEKYRASLQSGLAAIDRLLPLCETLGIVLGANELDTMLSNPDGMGTDDIQKALGIRVSPNSQPQC